MGACRRQAAFNSECGVLCGGVRACMVGGGRPHCVCDCWVFDSSLYINGVSVVASSRACVSSGLPAGGRGGASAATEKLRALRCTHSFAAAAAPNLFFLVSFIFGCPFPRLLFDEPTIADSLCVAFPPLRACLCGTHYTLHTGFAVDAKALVPRQN